MRHKIISMVIVFCFLWFFGLRIEAGQQTNASLCLDKAEAKDNASSDDLSLIVFFTTVLRMLKPSDRDCFMARMFCFCLKQTKLVAIDFFEQSVATSDFLMGLERNQDMVYRKDFLLKKYKKEIPCLLAQAYLLAGYYRTYAMHSARHNSPVELSSMIFDWKLVSKASEKKEISRLRIGLQGLCKASLLLGCMGLGFFGGL